MLRYSFLFLSLILYFLIFNNKKNIAKLPIITLYIMFSSTKLPITSDILVVLKLTVDSVLYKTCEIALLMRFWLYNISYISHLLNHVKA